MTKHAIARRRTPYIAGDLVVVKKNLPGHQLAVVLEVKELGSAPAVYLYFLGWPGMWDLAALDHEIRRAAAADYDAHPEHYLAVLASRYGADFTVLGHEHNADATTDVATAVG